MNIQLDFSTIKAGKRFDLSNPITAAFKSLEIAIRESSHQLVEQNGDAVFVFGSITKRKMDTERAVSIQRHRNRGAKIFSLDSALFSSFIRRHNKSSETFMFRIGLNDCTGEGNFLNENSNSNRYEWFKNTFNFSERQPHIDNQAPIFFALQSEKGWTYDDEKPYYERAREIIQSIRERTDRTIILKPHPNTDRHPIEWISGGFENIRILGQDRSRRDIIDDLKGVGAFVTHSSSAACESFVEGVPTFALDRRCVVYEACENTLDKINSLQEVDWSHREQTLRNWAMTSWHVNELENPDLIHYYISKAENT